MSDLLELVNKFKPVFVLHEEEKFLPLSFPTYVKGCSLIESTSGNKIVEYPNLKAEDLINPLIDERLGVFTPTKEIALNLEDMTGESYFGSPLETTVPSYVFTNNINFDGEQYIDIIYNIMYGFNEAPTSIFSSEEENHIYDLEFVTIRIKASDNTFNSAYFSAHGGGGWYKESDVEFNSDGHLVAFVAKGSHSNWPTGGIHIRLFGFGNDVCSSASVEERIIFNPSVVLLSSYIEVPFLTPGYEYMAYPGSMSQDVKSNMVTYDISGKLDSLSYKPYKALDLSGPFLSSKVDFDIKKVLISVISVLFFMVLVIQFFVMKKSFTFKSFSIQFLIFILTIGIGFVSSYSRFFL